MPEMVVKEIERIQSAFLSGSLDLRRKVHLVKWEDVSKSKSIGGLGVSRVEVMNICLLLKWWWRFGVEENSLWKEVICGKYIEQGRGWFPSTVRDSRMSKIWGDIVNTVASRPELLHFFRSNAVVLIGDGQRARFWTDCWSGGICLRDEFPRLYSLSNVKDGSVSLFHTSRDAFGNWVFNLRRSLFASDEEELSRLSVHLSSIPLLRANVPDCLTWNATPSGTILCFALSLFIAYPPCFYSLIY